MFGSDFFLAYLYRMGEPAIDPVATSADLHLASRELREHLHTPVFDACYRHRHTVQLVI